MFILLYTGKHYNVSLCALFITAVEYIKELFYWFKWMTTFFSYVILRYLNSSLNKKGSWRTSYSTRGKKIVRIPRTEGRRQRKSIWLPRLKIVKKGLGAIVRAMWLEFLVVVGNVEEMSFTDCKHNTWLKYLSY